MAELKPKRIKNRVVILKAMSYKGCMAYVRMIGTDLFMYDLIYKNEIYSGNMVITPRNGQSSLNTQEIQNATALLWAGATTTINTLLGETVNGVDKERAEAILEVIESVGKSRVVN